MPNMTLKVAVERKRYLEYGTIYDYSVWFGSRRGGEPTTVACKYSTDRALRALGLPKPKDDEVLTFSLVPVRDRVPKSLEVYVHSWGGLRFYGRRSVLGSIETDMTVKGLKRFGLDIDADDAIYVVARDVKLEKKRPKAKAKGR